MQEYLLHYVLNLFLFTATSLSGDIDGACVGLSDALRECKPYECRIYAKQPDFEVAHKVKGMEDGKCIHLVQSLDNRDFAECKTGEATRKDLAAFMLDTGGEVEVNHLMALDRKIRAECIKYNFTGVNNRQER